MNLCQSQAEQESLNPSTSEIARLRAAEPLSEPPIKKRKGPKGPNPLSVKKRKPAPSQLPAKNSGKGKVEEGTAQAMKQAKSLDSDRSQSVGKKRERDETTKMDGPRSEGQNAESHGEGHKRKRRRKATTQSIQQASPSE